MEGFSGWSPPGRGQHRRRPGAADLATHATCAVARFFVGYVDSRWVPVTEEVERVAAITSGYLTATVG